jgi:peptide/nickel transport system permease protein
MGDIEVRPKVGRAEITLTPPRAARRGGLGTLSWDVRGGGRRARWLSGVLTFCGRKPLGAAGAVMLLLLGLVALLAPIIAPYDPYELHPQHLYAPPSRDFPLGTDQVGRDVLSRLCYGARISLFVGFVSVGIGITVGALLGLVSAYLRGRFDLVVQRVVDALMGFPAIILALAIMAMLGASLINVILALVIVLAPSAVRTMRAQALAVREMDYIVAAKALGCGHARILFRHLVPNCLGVLIVLATISLGYAIITEASLSFLGVGVPPDVPTWGGMLAKAGSGYVEAGPWLAIFPGLALTLAVFGFNLLGDALRDVLDPRLRGR